MSRRPDPILAAIEAHQAAWEAYATILTETAGCRFLSPREARRHAARDAFHAATEILTGTGITTWAGIAALMAHLRPFLTPGDEFRRLYHYGFQFWDVADALMMVAEATERLAPKDRQAATRRGPRHIAQPEIRPVPG